MSNILNDPKMQTAFRKMVSQAEISCIIETGTHQGDSTKWFAGEVAKVLTVELDRVRFDLACHNLAGIQNVTQYYGSSDELLPEMLSEAKDERMLLVLDAHWEVHWPLLGELLTINIVRSQGRKMTVVIDDWIVPDQPQFAGCYGGLKGDDAAGHEHELRPCNYETFADELNTFPHFVEPAYPEGGIGYCIASDFDFDLGSDFRKIR